MMQFISEHSHNYLTTWWVGFGPELCKVRCFPPVALVWDPPFGLEVLPNLESEIIIVDSAPAIWGSSYGSEQTTILLMVYIMQI